MTILARLFHHIERRRILARRLAASIPQSPPPLQRPCNPRSAQRAVPVDQLVSLNAHDGRSVDELLPELLKLHAAMASAVERERMAS